eukprot:5435381-Prymnesium_polylepis.1
MAGDARGLSLIWQVMRVERWDDLQDAQGHAVVDRTVKLTFKKNPVPQGAPSDGRSRIWPPPNMASP